MSASSLISSNNADDATDAATAAAALADADDDDETMTLFLPLIISIGPTVEICLTLVTALLLYVLSVRSLGKRWSFTHYVLFTNLHALNVVSSGSSSSLTTTEPLSSSSTSSSSSSKTTTVPDDDDDDDGNDQVQEEESSSSSAIPHSSPASLNSKIPRKRKKNMQQSSSASQHNTMAREGSHRQHQQKQQQQQHKPSSAKEEADALSFSARTLQAGCVTMEALQQGRESTLLWKTLDATMVFGLISSIVLCLLRILRRRCLFVYHCHYSFVRLLLLLPKEEEDAHAYGCHDELQQKQHDRQRSFGHLLLGLFFLLSIRQWWKLATLVGQTMPLPSPPLQSSSVSSSRRRKMTEPRTYVHAVFLAGVVHYWWCTCSSSSSSSNNASTTITLIENAMEELAVRTLLWFRLLLGQDVLTRLAVRVLGMVHVVGSAASSNHDNNDTIMMMQLLLDMSVRILLKWFLILGTAVIAVQALVEPIQTMQIAIAHQWYVGNHLRHLILPRLLVLDSKSSSATSATTISWKQRLARNLREQDVFPRLRLVLVTFPPLLHVIFYVWISSCSRDISTTKNENGATANNSIDIVASWRLFAGGWLFVVGLAMYVKSLLQDYLFSALLLIPASAAMHQQGQEQEQSQHQSRRSDDSSSLLSTPPPPPREIFQHKYRGLLYQASQLTIFPILMTLLCSVAFWTRPIMMMDNNNNAHNMYIVNPVTYSGPLLDRHVLRQWWREQQQQHQQQQQHYPFSWLQSQLFVTARVQPPTVCVHDSKKGEDGDGGAGSTLEEEDKMSSSYQQPAVIIHRPRDLLVPRLSTTTTTIKVNNEDNNNNIYQSSPSHPPSLLYLLKQLQGLIRASSDNKAIRRALLGLEDESGEDRNDHHPASSSSSSSSSKVINQVYETKRAIRDTWQSLIWHHYFVTGRIMFIIVDFCMFVLCLYWILTLAYTMTIMSSSTRKHSSLQAQRLRLRNVVDRLLHESRAVPGRVASQRNQGDNKSDTLFQNIISSTD